MKELSEKIKLSEGNIGKKLLTSDWTVISLIRHQTHTHYKASAQQKKRQQNENVTRKTEENICRPCI